MDIPKLPQPPIIEKLDTTSEVNSEKKVESKTNLEQEEVATIQVAKPISQRNKGISGTSIKSLLEEDKEVLEERNRDDLPKEAFTLEAFILQWNVLLKKLNEEGKSAAIGAIKNVEIQKTAENRIEFLFHSNAAKAEFDKLKTNWLEDLSKALNNYHIEIVSRVELTENNQPNFKLPEEIYKDMVAKNPTLEKLRIQLGLELK